MTPTLPPERDLPPDRHAALRDEIIPVVNPSTPARRTYRWIAPASAAAAVVVVAASAGAATGLLPTGHRGPAAPAVSPTPTQDTPTPAGSPGPTRGPTVAGVPPDRAAQILRDCAQSAGLDPASPPPQFSPTLTPPTSPALTPPTSPALTLPPSPTLSPPVPGPGPTRGPSDAGIELRNVVSDGLGTAAFLLGRDASVFCTAPPGGAFRGSLAGRPGAQRPDPISVDHVAGGASIIKSSTGADGDRVVPESETAAGRIRPDVAKVTVTGVNGVTTTATIANGTFLARIVHTGVGRPVTQPDFFLVRAYGTRGQLLREVHLDLVPRR